MKRSFGYKIIMDDATDRVSVEEYLNDKRGNIPVCFGYGSKDPEEVAVMCRATAYKLLERADSIQHCRDFYHESSVIEQIEQMMDEHHSIFETN